WGGFSPCAGREKGRVMTCRGGRTPPGWGPVWERGEGLVSWGGLPVAPCAARGEECKNIATIISSACVEIGRGKRYTNRGHPRPGPGSPSDTMPEASSRGL